MVIARIIRPREVATFKQATFIGPLGCGDGGVRHQRNSLHALTVDADLPGSLAQSHPVRNDLWPRDSFDLDLPLGLDLPLPGKLDLKPSLGTVGYQPTPAA